MGVPTPALVIGSSGQLGGALVEILRARGVETGEIPGPEVADVADAAAMDAAIERHRPAIVLNAAAWTDVDGAETDEPAADEVNHVGAANVARACRRHAALLVHVSTDYVFDGSASTPYRPDDVPRPINAYGRGKLAGERAVAAEGGPFLIVRTSWLFGPVGRNFVTTILGKARDRHPLRVVDDQRGRPTYAPDLAGMILSLASRGARGVFHAANSGDCTFYELACAVIESAALRCEVTPCGSDETPRPAARPVYSVLDTSGTDDLIGPARPWRDAVDECVDRLAGEPIT